MKLANERSVSRDGRFNPVKIHWYRFYKKPGSVLTRRHRKLKPGCSALMGVRSVKTRQFAAFYIKNQHYDLQIKF
jgi:hypothetical protein